MRSRVLLGLGGACAIYAGLLAGSSLWAQAAVPHEACPADGTLLQIDTRARVLSLCRAGHEDASFRVALGRGGVDKRLEGDGRTPRGQYRLSPARASTRYHLFLPVGYPTNEQLNQGFSGSAIGVHGPHVAFAWLGRATTWPDWTLGCIALGTRGDVAQVAQWVADNRAHEIIIL
jgi:L,D-peptidoglycan transpeptidase YkuD (ErfK/YbiS/YcfS/YnhG family)